MVTGATVPCWESATAASDVIRARWVAPLTTKMSCLPRADFYEFFTKTATGDDAIARAEHLLAVFDSMARDFSRAVLRYWDWDTNPRIAHITRLMARLEGDININDMGDMSAFS